MKSTLKIPVSNGRTSLNGLITLFIHHWSGNISSLNLVHPYCSDSDSYIFPIKAPTSTLVDDDFAELTTLPSLVVGESENLHELTVSGLAAVCRHVIKSSENDQVKQSLGFRANCLQAPAEVSIWTSFCEVQMPQSAAAYLGESQQELDIVDVPAVLVQFEEHLKQPIRMHNVMKRWQQEVGPQAAAQQENPQKLAGTLLDHTYAEGADMTLADLLLYPCVTLLADRFSSLGVQLGDHLPRVGRWLSIMTPQVAQAWSTAVPDESFGLDRLTIKPTRVVKLPRVKEASLYKKDSSRPTVGGLTSEESARVVDWMKQQKLWPGNEEKEGDDHVEVAHFSLAEVDYINVDACNDFEPRIDWSSLPGAAHPQRGHVPGK